MCYLYKVDCVGSYDSVNVKNAEYRISWLLAKKRFSILDLDDRPAHFRERDNNRRGDPVSPVNGLP